MNIYNWKKINRHGVYQWRQKSKIKVEVEKRDERIERGLGEGAGSFASTSSFK